MVILLSVSAPVIPTRHSRVSGNPGNHWMPAFAGMTIYFEERVSVVLELDAQRHAAPAAAGAGHRDEDLLLLLFREIGIGQHLRDLLTHRVMDRLLAREHLDRAGLGRFGFGLLAVGIAHGRA